MKPDQERGQPTPMARALMLAVRAYQVGLSGFLPPRCRFVPSCSAYALEALRIHGAARGGWLACRRICRCHPWGGHGLDPVPPREGISPREGSRPSIQSTRKDS